MKGGWNTVTFYFLSSVSLSRMASTPMLFQVFYFSDIQLVCGRTLGPGSYLYAYAKSSKNVDR